MISKGIARCFKALQGRHTFFAAAFATFGSILAWYHRLDSTYVSFVTVMMGFILGHSVKEDYFHLPPCEGADGK